jgi:mRNA deadenylase 3'-5' endonuclease subunit Ccr4
MGIHNPIQNKMRIYREGFDDVLGCFKSVYENYRTGNDPLESHPEATKFTNEFQGNVDYIFHNSHAHPLSLLELPSMDVLTEETALPCSRFPSTHLYLKANFRLRFKKKLKEDNSTGFNMKMNSQSDGVIQTQH